VTVEEKDEIDKDSDLIDDSFNEDLNVVDDLSDEDLFEEDFDENFGLIDDRINLKITSFNCLLVLI
jgi:hypothetical protein